MTEIITEQPQPPQDFGRTPTVPGSPENGTPILPVDPKIVSNPRDTTGGNRAPDIDYPVPTGPDPQKDEDEEPA